MLGKHIATAQGAYRGESNYQQMYRGELDAAIIEILIISILLNQSRYHWRVTRNSFEWQNWEAHSIKGSLENWKGNCHAGQGWFTSDTSWGPIRKRDPGSCQPKKFKNCGGRSLKVKIFNFNYYFKTAF